MKDERIPKKILNGKLYNTRPVGKPRTRWEDVFQRDISQILGITRMEQTSRKHRMERFLREARAQKGLCCQR
jgi:hypothetical protein